MLDQHDVDINTCMHTLYLCRFEDILCMVNYLNPYLEFIIKKTKTRQILHSQVTLFLIDFSFIKNFMFS